MRNNYLFIIFGEFFFYLKSWPIVSFKNILIIWFYLSKKKSLNKSKTNIYNLIITVIIIENENLYTKLSYNFKRLKKYNLYQTNICWMYYIWFNLILTIKLCHFILMYK